MPAPRLRARRGFALPLALFFIGIMTVTIAASYIMASGERRSNQSQVAQQRAYNAAAVGLETYLGGRTALGLAGVPSASEDASVQVNGSTDDSAFVTARRIRPESGVPGSPSYVPAFYLVRSRGIYRGNRLPGANNSERTVGILTYYERGNLQVLAGWTSLSGLRKNGNAGTLSGVDACSAANGGGAATVAGIAVPTGQFSGNDAAMSGNPPIRELGTQQQANDQVKIDWQGIQNGTAITADFTNSWPTAAQYGVSTFWPTILFQGDVSLPNIASNQRGLLIVTGNLTINGGTTWDGIILVGGNLTSNGNNTVYGAVVTGLDEKVGEDVITNDVGNGTKIYQYNSCNVAKAAGSMGGFRPVKNTFVDNWKSY